MNEANQEANGTLLPAPSNPTWQQMATQFRAEIMAAYLPIIEILQRASDEGFTVSAGIRRNQLGRFIQTVEDVQIVRHF